jgi:hypothetical protein
MIPMYLLMSAFHSSPWLKLMSSRRNFTDRIEPPHSNRRSPPMLSGRWQRWLASERALLPRPIRFQRPASTTARPLLGRQPRNFVPFWPGLGRWPGRAAMAGKGHDPSSAVSRARFSEHRPLAR